MRILKETIKTWREHPEKAVRIVAFGSSNTELHWHSLGHFNWLSWVDCAMREWIGRHITMINQGISGETAKDLTKRIERDVISYAPDLVIITIGGNDAFQGYSTKDYREYLIEIIERIQEIGTLPILQTYYCPLYERMSEAFHHFPEFVEVNRTLASEKKIPLIDQYKYFSPFYENDRENYVNLMLDGLHVNPTGNAVMGVIACRSLYLPDPKFLMDTTESKKYLNLMNKYCELPPRRSKKGRKIIKK